MVRVILGRRGSGKTRLARMLLAEENPKWLAVIDPLNEHEMLSPVQAREKTDWIVRLQTETWPVRIVPTNEAEYRLALAALACRSSWHLFIDEVDMYEDARSSEQLGIILNYGRHYQQDVTLLARRPAAMPRLATSQADELWIFSMWEPRDVKYVQDYSQVDAADIPASQVWCVRADDIRNPDRYEYDRAALTLEPVNGGGDATRLDTGSSDASVEDASREEVSSEDVPQQADDADS